MPSDAIVDAAIAALPDLTPALARDLRALLAMLVDASPGAAIVLGGSVASPRYGDAARSSGHDIDLFLIEPTRAAALRTLRARPLRRALESLPLTASAEIVVLWDTLVRDGRTSVYGRLLIGDPALADAIARSPAPPQANLLRTAHLYLVESLLEPTDAGRLVAKATLTAFRAWVRGRRPDATPMSALFALDATADALAAARAELPPHVVACVGDALAWQSGRTVAWHPADARTTTHAFLATLDDGRATRRLRRWLRHAGARLHFGASPFQLLDADRCFIAAARALVDAALDVDVGGTTSPERGSRAAPGDALASAESLIGRLTGARLGDARATGARVGATRLDRLHRAALALRAYGQDYPHKILLPAPPPVAAVPGSALVSVIVPCRNGAATLPALLASIAAQAVPPGYALETIVADNGSTDGSRDLAQRGGAVVVDEPRRGASAARNAGARRARGDTLVFLDADTHIVGRDFLHRMLRALARDAQIGIVGAAIECDEPTTMWGRADHMVSFFNWHPTQLAEKRHFHPSAALAVRRSAWDAVGGFATELLVFHDFDFCRRARDLGFSIYFEPAARVAHHPREDARASIRHAARWGWNVRRVYAPYDIRRWWFLDRPLLFAANVPVEVLNRIWVVGKRWIWRRPRDTIVLLPFISTLVAAWGAGVAIGGYRWISTGSASGATARSRSAATRDERRPIE